MHPTSKLAESQHLKLKRSGPMTVMTVIPNLPHLDGIRDGRIKNALFTKYYNGLDKITKNKYYDSSHPSMSQSYIDFLYERGMLVVDNVIYIRDQELFTLSILAL